jgi:hypothetical protein
MKYTNIKNIFSFSDIELDLKLKEYKDKIKYDNILEKRNALIINFFNNDDLNENEMTLVSSDEYDHIMKNNPKTYKEFLILVNNKTGMKINNNMITHISGPISFHLLKPNMKNFLKYKKLGIYIPIVMLFGDKHNSDLYECKNCNNGCYKIEDENFLKIIETLSTKEKPVDFYLESLINLSINKKLENDDFSILEKIKKYNSNNESSLQKMNNTLQSCFYKNFKEKLKCPIPNIRWHFADIRHFSMVTYDETYKFKYEMFLGTDAYFLNQSKSLKLILNDCYNETTEFIDFYFDINNEIVNNKSLILKQIKKGKISIEKWKKWFTQFYLEIIILYNNKKFSKTKISEFIEIYNYYSKLSKIDRQEYKQKNDEFKLKPIHVLFRSITAIFLDMYFITRMFKPPENDVMSHLTIGYFGNAHVYNIIYFCVKIMKLFKIEKSVNNKLEDNDQMRCLKMPNFDLIKELNSYK